MTPTKKRNNSEYHTVVELLQRHLSGRSALAVLVAVVVIGGGIAIGVWHTSVIQSHAERLGAVNVPLTRMVATARISHTQELTALERLSHHVRALEREPSTSNIEQCDATVEQFQQIADTITRTLIDAERLDLSAFELWSDYDSLITPLSKLRIAHDRLVIHVETVGRLVDEERWPELSAATQECVANAAIVGQAANAILVHARNAETEAVNLSRSHELILLWNTIALACLAGGASALLVAPVTVWRTGRPAHSGPQKPNSGAPPKQPVAVRSEAKSPKPADGNGPAAFPASSEPLILAGRRILVTDDGPANQRLFAAILRKAGAEVQLASHGHQAIDCVNQSNINATPFDVILMDLDMPMLDGLGATAKLREQGCTVPIIAVTASEFKANREQCLSSGFDDFFTKPVAKDRLLRAIDQQIRRTGQQELETSSSSPASS